MTNAPETLTAKPQRDVSLAMNIVAAPFIYAVLGPLAALDFAVSLYQAVCFRIWGIAQVKRAPFMRFDRHKLAYLNFIQRLNCRYCSYANGVLAYASEVASKTEQYWCPVQHETDPPNPHRRYRDFIVYGDPRAFDERSKTLRAKVRDED